MSSVREARSPHPLGVGVVTMTRNFINPLSFTWRNTDCNEFLPMCMIGIKWILMIPLLPLYCVGLLYGYMCEIMFNEN